MNCPNLLTRRVTVYSVDIRYVVYELFCAADVANHVAFSDVLLHYSTRF